MNVYEEILSVQQIHFVEIHLDRLLYVNFDLLENEKFLFDFFSFVSVIVFRVIKC